jgi:hypothetical protein
MAIKRGCRRTLLAVLAALLSAGAGAATGRQPTDSDCHYDIELRDPAANRLFVAFSCAAGAPLRFGTFAGSTDANIAEVRSRHSQAVTKGGMWIIEREGGRAQGTYVFHTDPPEAAATTRGVRRVGDSVLTSPRALLLLPERGTHPAALSLRFRTLDGAAVAAGLLREHDLYRLHTDELPYIGFMALGKVTTRDVLVPGRYDGKSVLQVAVLDVAHALTDDEIASWVSESAGHVAAYFGGFPTPRGLLLLRPVSSQTGLLRGMVNGGGGATMLLLFGAETPARLLRDQWMLMHELVHFSAPFIEDHPWIMEGMAVYVETTLRVRAGWFPEEQAWRGIMRNVPQGVPAMEKGGLVGARGIGPVYWGGALFWLLADVETRSRTANRKSIAHCFRGVLDAGGDTSARWPIDRFVAACDGALGLPIVRSLYERFAVKGSPVDLYGLWSSLGIRLTKYEAGVAYDDSAPLAEVRRAIMAPPPRNEH